MKWYGWIPTLAGEEVLEYLSQIFIKSCPLVVKNSEIILNSKSIREIIDVNPNELKNFLENLFPIPRTKDLKFIKNGLV